MLYKWSAYLNPLVKGQVGCRFGSYFAEVLVKSSKDNLEIFRRNIGFGEPDLFLF